MKVSPLTKVLVPAALLLLLCSSAIAADCSGSWRVLPNYSPGSGGACAALGLNTRQPTCQPGQRYATLCDDASDGRYRICQSSTPCAPHRQRDHGYGRHRDKADYRSWEDRSNYQNYQWYGGPERWDGRGGFRDTPRNNRYEHQHGARNCTQWDFTANRPCAPGTINLDCRFDCASRMR